MHSGEQLILSPLHQVRAAQMLSVAISDFSLILKVLYHRQCQYTQANEYHFDGANSIETTNH